MTETIINMDDLAKCWGARNWAECSAAIRDGYAWAQGQNYEIVLIERKTGCVISPDQWRAQRK